MSEAQRDYQRFVDLVYEASLDDSLWPETLETLSRSVGAMGAVLLPCAAPTAIRPYHSNVFHEASIAFERRWWREDVVWERIAKRNLRGPVQEVDVCTPEEAARLPFFQEFRREFGIGGSLILVDGGEMGSQMSIALLLPTGKTRLSAEERQRFDRLLPHAVRALRLGARLSLPINSKAMIEDSLSALSAAIAILDSQGRVVFVNRRFDALRQRGLRIVGRRLVTEAVSQQAALDQWISQTTSDCLPITGDAVMAVRRSSGRPLILRFTPFKGDGRRETAFRLPSHRAALVIVMDPDQTLSDAQSGLFALGLTPKEAKVAALIGAGVSPSEAAQQLGNSEATVRTVLKRIFGKLGVERQSQLAALVARLGLLSPR